MFQTLNNGDLMGTVRGKINGNFSIAEVSENKTQSISDYPSSERYPSESAVYDYASKIYSDWSVPITKSGDLLLQNTGENVGKIQYNSGGTLNEFIPDRAICDYRSSTSFNGTTLLSGEIAVETDTNKMKVGDGSTPYSMLPYIGTTEGGSSGGGSTTEGIFYGGSNEHGWIQYPNGMIMQWGCRAYMSNSEKNFDQIITLPTSFSSQRIYSHAVLETGNDWNLSQLIVHSRSSGLSRIRFTVDASFYVNNQGYGLNVDSLYELRWIAIGF